MAADHTIHATFALQQSQVTTLEVRVAAFADDGEENASGIVNISSSDLELMKDGTNLQRAAAMRFRGLAIPRGAVIKEVAVRGEESDHPGPGGGQRRGVHHRVSTRLQTAASAAWAPAAWTAVGEAGTNQRTPELKALFAVTAVKV